MCDDSEAIPRLGIKKFNWWSEALHGVANQGNVTVFPEPVGMAASFNDKLVFEIFNAVSDEMRAKHNERVRNGLEDVRFHSLSVWTPNVNIFRDPRWGRGQETYGEDPYLTSQMGIAVVKGLQGPENEKYRKLLACAKHYAVHSGPEWSRHTANLNNVSPRDLWETYLPAFKALVQKADVREVMCAYQRLDDDPCCGNTRLLQQILRDEWGFEISRSLRLWSHCRLLDFPQKFLRCRTCSRQRNHGRYRCGMWIRIRLSETTGSRIQRIDNGRRSEQTCAPPDGRTL